MKYFYFASLWKIWKKCALCTMNYEYLRQLKMWFTPLSGQNSLVQGKRWGSLTSSTPRPVAGLSMRYYTHTVLLHGRMTADEAELMCVRAGDQGDDGWGCRLQLRVHRDQSRAAWGLRVHSWCMLCSLIQKLSLPLSLPGTFDPIRPSIVFFRPVWWNYMISVLDNNNTNSFESITYATYKKVIGTLCPCCF
jgi:hypothetical protein